MAARCVWPRVVTSASGDGVGGNVAVSGRGSVVKIQAETENAQRSVGQRHYPVSLAMYTIQPHCSGYLVSVNMYKGNVPCGNLCDSCTSELFEHGFPTSPFKTLLPGYMASLYEQQLSSYVERDLAVSPPGIVRSRLYTQTPCASPKISK